MEKSKFRSLYDIMFPPVFVHLERHTGEAYTTAYGQRVLRWKFYRNFGVKSRIDQIDEEFVLITESVFPIPLITFGAIVFIAAFNLFASPEFTALLLAIMPITYFAHRGLQSLESKHAHRDVLERTRKL